MLVTNVIFVSQRKAFYSATFDRRDKNTHEAFTLIDTLPFIIIVDTVGVVAI